MSYPAIENNLPEDEDEQRRKLAVFAVASAPGNERQAMEAVIKAVRGLSLSPRRLERLKTAVGEATMNAMEHGNEYRVDQEVEVCVLASPSQLIIQITDHGGGQQISEPETPDLDAKLQGTQSPRGWGLYLIKKMVDDLRIDSDEYHHTIELIMNLKGFENAEAAV